MTYAPADWWPHATRRPVTYWPDAPTFTARPLGWILHVTAGYGSPWATFQYAPDGARKFSHLWIAQSGAVEQYAPLSHDSWAQAGGNASYWSCETEGMPAGSLTDAQLDALAAWHAWCGADDLIADAPGQRGVGTHQMGGADWGNHTCPDPAMGLPGPRSRQRPEIIRRATGAATVTPAEIDAVASAVLAKFAGWAPPGTGDASNWQTVEGRDYTMLGAILAGVQALQHGGPVTLSQPQIDALAAAVAARLPASALTAGQVADEIARRLTA